MMTFCGLSGTWVVPCACSILIFAVSSGVADELSHPVSTAVSASNDENKAKRNRIFSPEKWGCRYP
ncbi:Uncharacterised protein [Yersinia enterocolitica]|nr:Uncharacterised protein [Yersinia enterocolitica]